MYNLNRKLEELEVQGKSIKIAIIGAGHMGTGMVSQVVNMKGMIPSIVADINVDLAKASFTKAGIAEDQIVIVEDEPVIIQAIQYIRERDTDEGSDKNEEIEQENIEESDIVDKTTV